MPITFHKENILAEKTGLTVHAADLPSSQLSGQITLIDSVTLSYAMDTIRLTGSAVLLITVFPFSGMVSATDPVLPLSGMIGPDLLSSAFYMWDLSVFLDVANRQLTLNGQIYSSTSGSRNFSNVILLSW